MKKLLIILFFASVLIYAKAEATTFYVYSESAEYFNFANAVARAFMRAGHRVANSEDYYFDYYAIVTVTTETENKSFLFWEWEKVEIILTVKIMDIQQYSIAMESDKGKGDNIDKLADKVVKKIDKALKRRN